ncbi:hypothetical protein [Uliginosibacterium sp. H1]|uniref:hypothetical protein n=1 Tax=Uliginosibacterium sp. H1 TaxID=3114757 RepID=UPI002E16ED75|nr:hypothetical protein [Uliginosibacterium sp. H1]
MISERIFARGFGSFWRSVMPWSERGVRTINLALRERFDAPLELTSREDDRGFLNELAFRIAMVGFGRNLPPSDWGVFEESLQIAVNKMAHFVHEGLLPVSEPGKNEAILLARRLHSQLLFHSRHSNLVFSPFFNGCGFVDACEGDILSGATLIEVKSGVRAFGSPDIRQLLTYCALARAGGGPAIDSVSLINPRQGVSFDISLDNLSDLLAGCSSTQLLDQIIQFAVSGHPELIDGRL